MMNSISTLLLAVAVTLWAAAVADATQYSPESPQASGAAESAGESLAKAKQKSIAASVSEGEIKKIDMEGGKLTIKSGPLKNLDMPAMTMSFRVSEPAVLGRLKAGDKINFVAEMVGGQLTATQLKVKK